MRRFIPFALVWCLSFGAAALPPARPALHWVRAKGAESCIDPKELAHRVEALTGPVFVSPSTAELTLEGTIERRGRGYRARIVSSAVGSRGAGEREIATDKVDCRTLDGALAFIIAVTIDPELSLGGVPPGLLAQFAQERPPEQALLAELERSPPSSVAVAIDEAAPAAPPGPPVAKEPKPNWERTHYRVGAAASLWGGTLPGWVWGAQANFSFDIPGVFPLTFSASAFGQSRSERTPTGQYASFRAYDAGLSVCPPLIKWSLLRVSGCAAAALSYLQGSGAGFEHNHSAHVWDPAVIVGLMATLSLGRGFALVADGSLRVRLTNQDFESTDEVGARHTAFRPARLGLVFNLGPAYEF